MKHKIFYFILILTLIVSCSKDDSISSDNDNEIDVNLNRQTVGSSANDLLSADKFTNMIIELVYVEGFEPNASTVNNFISFIQSTSFKPDGITIEKRSIPSPNKDTFTIQEIADIERENRQFYNTDNQIAVWAFFADGQSSNDTNNTFTLGSAYWNTSFVIFEETVRNLSDSAFEPDRTLLETTVINHEFGHILGLTNLGSDMQQEHEDEDHPKHCDVESCLMFWTQESSAGIDEMVNMSSAPELDAQCKADLQANGGK
ncbi:membrane metalloprotease [Winogradskyella ursingii]|uniref:membrane metalloprotease n=1 Tax=Winogradskyella ursingii TaxID=2686079 RepID=UPI0015CD4A86|nr:membrane metalloprotease [Winogradskyella ursingii]